MRKTKSEGKTVGILIGLRNSQSVRNLFARLRISQCTCEIGKLLQHSGLGSNTGMGFLPKNGLH